MSIKYDFASGTYQESPDGKIFFFMDGQQFLQTLYENAIKNDIKFDDTFQNLTKISVQHLLNQYEIKENEVKDMFDVFCDIKIEDIKKNKTLFETVKNCNTLKEKLEKTSLTPQEKRVISLAFLNDEKLSIKAQKPKKIEEESLKFKNIIGYCLGLNELANFKALNFNSGIKNLEKIEPKLIKNNVLINITQEAYFSSQTHAEEQTKRQKIKNILKKNSQEKKPQNTLSQK